MLPALKLSGSIAGGILEPYLPMNLIGSSYRRKKNNQSYNLVTTRRSAIIVVKETDF